MKQIANLERHGFKHLIEESADRWAFLVRELGMKPTLAD